MVSQKFFCTQNVFEKRVRSLLGVDLIDDGSFDLLSSVARTARWPEFIVLFEDC
jgi:hypothetical protein